ncbi:MAG: hypothetical protein ACRCZD_13525 [Phycicoccus sp.]
MDDSLVRDVDRLCRLTGSFVLRSGRTVPEYFDKYRFEAEPETLRRVATPADLDVAGGH